MRILKSELPGRSLAIAVGLLWLSFAQAFATLDLDTKVEFSYARYSDAGDTPFELRDRDEIDFTGTLEPHANHAFVVAAAAVDTVFAEVVVQYGGGWARIVGTAASVIGATPDRTEAGGGGEFAFLATLRDTVTITAPGRATGTPGTARIGVLADGVLSADSDFHVRTGGEGSFAQAWGTGSLGARLTAIDSVSNLVGGDVADPTGAGLIDGPPALGINDAFLGGSLNFLFGVPIDIEIQMIAEGGASGSSSFDNGASASAVIVVDFGRTVTWAGVEDVRDAEGVPIADFTALSSTGLDFRHAIVAPVPLPPSGLLLLASVLLAMKDRRRRFRAPATQVRRAR